MPNHYHLQLETPQANLSSVGRGAGNGLERQLRAILLLGSKDFTVRMMSLLNGLAAQIRAVVRNLFWLEAIYDLLGRLRSR
jgi:hypothetical protein